MTSTHDEAPSDSSTSRVPGQVCDRCRRFYETEGIEQRRETPPDVSQHATDTAYPLQNPAVPISRTSTRPLSVQSAAQGTALPTTSSSSSHQMSTAQVPSQHVPLNPMKEPVIGHMGRLVADDRQAPMFGGSTTGVHFISQAEQQLQLLHMHKDALPSCAYGLYLHSPWGASVHSSASPVVDIIAQLPPNTIEIVEATVDRWTPLYPIVHRSSTIDAIHGLLSSFSSAYHGMPRLIRDQDVDTDFPTSVDHNLLSRTHVEFPLPGERSQVDTAISLFKLARIVGRTLEDLYTTTRRRGGVAKIARLQAELNMWERVVLEPELESEPATSVTTKSLEATFLRVAHCVATIHIHRPALSFTTADPQFVSSLKACGQASANLVELLSSSLGTLGTNHATGQVMMGDWPETMLVTLLYPNGIHMLWQAGLTILFTGWKGYPVTVDQDENLIRICIATLREFHRHTDDVGNHIGQCADVLELLCKKVFSELETLPDLEQLQWNIWDWPIASALELVNTLDIIPLDLSLNLYQ
ncbi:Transcriptional activator protein acu-15 [Fusarium odoratissimum]|uniref:Transcriptional activator protein acu-15 n=1 Tax=Fusarium oxysporum f. sp. cubense (strain race 4) TaxID=2502994 RepID=N1SAM8_FUSC4|nr:Transcriptional activator protein acu-15 [Fusarium odoratissimum]